jgi:solute carrier family 25 oxoglutarate transporter 11
VGRSARLSAPSQCVDAREPLTAAPSKGYQTFVNFSTAGMGGILGWILIHPMNTVAVRMNLHNLSRSGTAVRPRASPRGSLAHRASSK